MNEFLETVFVPSLTLGAIYALIAVGFTVLFRVTGILNFAHGQLVVLAPMAVLVAQEDLGASTFVAFLIAFVAIIVFALIEERLAVRPFLQSGDAVPWIVSTLGASIVIGELLAIPFGGESRSFPHGLSTRPTEVLGFSITPADMALIASSFVMVFVLQLLYTRTRLGLRLEAVREDIQGAAAIGIHAGRMSQIAMVASALVAGVTGIALAPTQLVEPTLGIQFTFFGFVAVSLGGLGSLYGSLLGGYVTGLVAQASSVYLGGLYVNVAVFGVLVALYLVRPYGLFGQRPLRTV